LFQPAPDYRRAGRLTDTSPLPRVLARAGGDDKAKATEPNITFFVKNAKKC